jgi:RND family efflux transporter MFP subunit
MPNNPMWLRRGCSAAMLALLVVLPAAADDDAASPVTLAEVRAERLRPETLLTGTSIAVRRAALSPRVEGLVTSLAVDEGSEVDPGDPILTLDARLAELEVKAAEARVAEAEARHRDAIRVRDELLRLQQGRHASKTDIESAIAQVEIADAAMSGARAELARARELVERHQLAAPFAGVIVAKLVEVGEWVQRDAAAVELVALDLIRVRATLPQRDYARVSPGSKVRLSFDALPEQVFDGEVVARVASGDQRTRSFPVLIDLTNPDRLLAPGMSARVSVELNDGTIEALTVPRDAIVAKSDGSRQVWRVDADADGIPRAKPVRVETGRAIGDRLELLSGAVDVGDQVVLLGNESLKPGQAVAPQEPQTAPLAEPAPDTAAVE